MTDKVTPPGEMVNIDVDFISLVRKGANRQKVQIYKADVPENEASDGEEIKGFFDTVKSFFVGKAVDAVSEGTAAKSKKQTSFAQSIAVSDIMDSMWHVNDTLRDVMRNVIADETVTDKKTAMTQAIDEFGVYMKDKINGTKIAKEAAFFDEPISKAGRVFSTKNLSAIKSAIAALQGLLTDPDENSNQEGADDTVKKEELQALMKAALGEALAPITERLDKVEKADENSGGETAAGETAAGETETGGETSDNDIAEVVKSAVQDALAPISERLEKVEKSRAVGRSSDGNPEPDKKVEKSESAFDGYFV
jgi:hypothetical protein